MTARPPAFSTAAATASESVATTASPTLAAAARRRTCTIIGNPPISASGLPGRRVEASRAGMRTSVSDIAGAADGCGKKRCCRSVYTGCLGRGKPVSDRRRRMSWRASESIPAPLPGYPTAMNSFELNKILGAILGTCLVLLALNIGAGAVFSPEKPAKPGYEIAVKEAPKAGEQKKEEKQIAALLASASADKGKSVARQCQACHTFEKGGPNRVGPNLWNIVGSPRGEDRGGFNFSTAMKTKGGNWSYDELNKFLTSPRSYIPGTAMTFAGITNDEQRADVIAYLRTLSDNPQPLPQPPQASS